MWPMACASMLGIYRSSPVSVSDAMDTTLLDVEL